MQLYMLFNPYADLSHSTRNVIYHIQNVERIFYGLHVFRFLYILLSRMLRFIQQSGIVRFGMDIRYLMDYTSLYWDIGQTPHLEIDRNSIRPGDHIYTLYARGAFDHQGILIFVMSHCSLFLLCRCFTVSLSWKLE